MNDYDPTRPFQPSEPDPNLDWEDDEGSPKLLWGRVLALAGTLLVAFLIGRASAPDDSADEVTRLQTQLAAARDEIEELENILATSPLTTETPPPNNDDETNPPPTDTPTDGETDEGDGDEGTVKEYTVKEGDTYFHISEEVFGDPQGWQCIQEANDNEGLDPGDTINVPDTCDPDA